jgi:hypothetical protein
MAKRVTVRSDAAQPAGAAPARDLERARRPGAERADSLEDEIRLRAYYRYLERDGEPGDAESDWLEAESDVLGRRATGVEAAERVTDNAPSPSRAPQPSSR